MQVIIDILNNVFEAFNLSVQALNDFLVNIQMITTDLENTTSLIQTGDPVSGYSITEVLSAIRWLMGDVFWYAFYFSILFSVFYTIFKICQKILDKLNFGGLISKIKGISFKL